MAKKRPAWVMWIIISVSLTVLFFLFILVVGVDSYLNSYKLPEGYTKSHHSYEDVIEFAKKIDPDATVSETYVVQGQSDHQSVREWPAKINGIECHVASTPEMFFDSRGSAYTRTVFGLDTDYDQIVIGLVLENFPELGELEEQGYSYLMSTISADDTDSTKGREQTHPRLPVRTTIKLDSIDEETFDAIWDSYVKANKEYSSYKPTRGYNLTINLSNGAAAYIENTSDEQYQIAKEKLFS